MSPSNPADLPQSILPVAMASNSAEKANLSDLSSSPVYSVKLLVNSVLFSQSNTVEFGDEVFRKKAARRSAASPSGRFSSIRILLEFCRQTLFFHVFEKLFDSLLASDSCS